MRMPNIEDIRDLANYTLMGDREKDDFKEQIELGDLEPDREQTIFELLSIEDEDDVSAAIESMDDDELQAFALAFGTSHAYPTAIRIMHALTQTPEVIETELDKKTKEKAEEAYERTLGKD